MTDQLLLCSAMVSRCDSCHKLFVPCPCYYKNDESRHPPDCRQEDLFCNLQRNKAKPVLSFLVLLEQQLMRASQDLQVLCTLQRGAGGV